jgi:hypothetical protein
MGLSTRVDTDTSNRVFGTLGTNVVVMVCVLTSVTLSLISSFFSTSLVQLGSFSAPSANIIANETAPKGMSLVDSSLAQLDSSLSTNAKVSLPGLKNMDTGTVLQNTRAFSFVPNDPAARLSNLSQSSNGNTSITTSNQVSVAEMFQSTSAPTNVPNDYRVVNVNPLITDSDDGDDDDFHHGNKTAIAAKKDLLLLSYPQKIPLPAGRLAKSREYRAYWLVASIKKNVAVTIIPKVMCTSIRHSLSMFDCGDTSRCSEARKNSKIKHLDVSNMTRVLFIRDPFERALSAYTNSDINKYISIGRCTSTAHCTFGQWVEAIANNTKIAFENEHFNPQVNIAQMDKMHYNYHLRMSSAVDQEFFWNNLLGMTKSFKKNKSLKNNITLSDKFKSVHLDTFEKLALIYDADLKLWERALEQWTPRQRGEVTTFDLYNVADRQREGEIRRGKDKEKKRGTTKNTAHVMPSR